MKIYSNIGKKKQKELEKILKEHYDLEQRNLAYWFLNEMFKLKKLKDKK